MTREEAIQILSTRDWSGMLCGYTSGYTEALNMAIEALQSTMSQERVNHESTNDLISRADAIEAVHGACVYCDTCDLKDIGCSQIQALSALQSAELANLKQEFASAEAVQGDSCDGCKYVGIIEKCEQCRRIYSEMDDLYKGGDTE